MNNLYQTPSNRTRMSATIPWWYLLFYKIYLPVWWIGTALIFGSWISVVSPTVGWIGFSMACAAWVGASVLPSIAGVKQQDNVLLDSRQLRTKGDDYREAIRRFGEGATLTYDGVAFGFRPGDEIACGVVANTVALDDASAMEFADHARAVFDHLISESREFAASVEGHTLRISIMSGFDANAREICRVVGGKVVWSKA